MNDISELMSAYLDGELDAKETERAHALLAQDPRAQTAYEEAKQMKSLVLAKCAPIEDPQLWKVVRSRFDEMDRAKRSEAFVGRYAWGLCALFVVAILSAAFMNRIGAGRSVSQAQVASFFSQVQNAGLRQAPRSADIADVVGMPFQQAPVRIPSRQCALEGVGQGTVDGRRAVLLRFVDEAGPFALLMFQGADRIHGMEVSGERNSDFVGGRLNGHPYLAWTENDFTMLLVGDRPTSELFDLAATLRR